MEQNREWDGFECDFYQVEEIDGKKMIHDDGYYYNAEDGTDTPYRRLQYTFLYLDPEKLGEDDMYYDREQEKVKQYIEDLSEEDCIRMLREDMKEAIHFPIQEVTDETPCGWYVDMRR